jgi:hypothetical protein
MEAHKPDEFAQQVIAIPNRVKIKCLPDRNQSAHSSCAGPIDETGEPSSHAEVRHGLIAGLDMIDEITTDAM